MHQLISLPIAKQNCRTCSHTHQCLPREFSGDERERFFRTAVRCSRVVKRGEHLFRLGQRFCSLYIVRSGSVKLYSLDDAEEQVLGFYLTGDLFGFDAIATGYHECAALALETSSICELGFAGLEDLSTSMHLLQKQMSAWYGREIARDFALLRLLGKKSAEQRLAIFLLDLSQRLSARGFSAHEFNLSMSRQDIGSYLGLALETVSRLFARLQEDGVITVDRRHITLLDETRLRELAGDCMTALRRHNC